MARTIGSQDSMRSRKASSSIASSTASLAAVAVAVRAPWSSIDSSSSISPGPKVPCSWRRWPSLEVSTTWPLSISHAQSAGSPCRYSTSPANSERRIVAMLLPEASSMWIR